MRNALIRSEALEGIMTGLYLALEHLRVDGWYVVEGIIPVEHVDAIRDRVEKSTAAHGNPKASKGIGHVPGFIRFDQSFAPYLANARLMQIVNGTLGVHARISFTTATINHPGNERVGRHVKSVQG